ncbi:hypothetical protein ACJX0J_040966, partial [Zea mays]
YEKIPTFIIQLLVGRATLIEQSMIKLLLSGTLGREAAAAAMPFLHEILFLSTSSSVILDCQKNYIILKFRISIMLSSIHS